MVKATIVLTTYNRPDLLKRALKSALNQTFKDYEIIVVDDYSDKGLDLSGSSINIPLKIIQHEWNKGLSAARNTGIKAAKGEYIVCLDDDNELMPTFLEKSMQSIGDYDAVAVGRVIQYKDFADYVVPGISKLSSIDWGFLIKKSVFEEIQYDENLRANEDTDFGIQFFKKFKATQLNEPLTIAHDSEDPRTSLSFPNERELEGMTKFFKKNFKEYDDPKEKWCLYRLMGRKFYRGGHRLGGLGWFIKGFWAHKTLRSLVHLLFLLPGWWAYDRFMTFEEKFAAKRR
jgi:glycosyltransferase involved in cell wall biosynthesis